MHDCPHCGRLLNRDNSSGYYYCEEGHCVEID